MEASAAPSPARLSPLLWALVLAVVALQVVKGLSLESGLYPLISYLWTYADGPVRRGLLPTFFATFGYSGRAVAPLLAMLHMAALAVLVVWILALGRRVLTSGGLRPWFFVLFLASPFLVLVSVLNGYSDVLQLLALLGVWALLQRGRVIGALALVALTTLQHEMVLVLTAPLFLAAAVFAPEQRKKFLLGFAVLVVFAGAFYVVTATTQPHLKALAAERCTAERPEGHPLVDKVWNRYCERTMRATLASDFVLTRPVLLPAFWSTYGVFVGVLGGLWVLLLQRQPTRQRRLLLLLPLIFANYALIFIAWDIDRIICIGFLPAWLLLDRWLAEYPEAIGRFGAVFCSVLVALQLCFTYPMVNVYGANRLLPPALSNQLFINPQDWTVAAITHYGLVIPPFLDPAVCVDPRCP